jgi:putative Mn2+ efflux pump MntP
MIGLLVSTMGVNYLFASFEPEDYDSWTRKTRLNRHAILHGISLKYANQVNSLKLFFLLVSLADTYEQLPYVNSGA